MQQVAQQREANGASAIRSPLSANGQTQGRHIEYSREVFYQGHWGGHEALNRKLYLVLQARVWTQGGDTVIKGHGLVRESH